MKTLLSVALIAMLAACSDSDPQKDSGVLDQFVPPSDGTPRSDLPPTNFTWTTTEVDKTPAFKARAAVAVSKTGTPHVAYNVATSPDTWTRPELWVGVRNGAAWSNKQLITGVPNDTAIEFPTLLVDGNNRTHLFFNRYIPEQQQIELFHAYSDDLINFSTPTNITNTLNANEFAVHAVLEGQDTIHLVFQQTQKVAEGDDVNAVGYIKITGGVAAPVNVVATGTQLFSLSPDYTVAVANGTVHVIYGREGASMFETRLFWVQDAPGGWSQETAVTADIEDAWSPVMVTDSTGVVHLVFVTGPGDDKTLTYDRFQGGAWLGRQALTTSVDDRAYYLGVVAGPDNTIHIAYLRFYETADAANGDIHYISGKDGVFAADQRLTNTPELDESNPAIALGPQGQVYISFVENLFAGPSGVVYVAAYE